MSNIKYYHERFHPLFYSFIATCVFFYFYEKIETVDIIISKLIDSSFVINGVLIGFLLTITTLISTITSRRMKFVKDSGTFPRIIKYLHYAIYFCIISISLSMATPILNLIIPNDCTMYFNCFMFGVIIFTWLLNIRFTIIFIKLLVDKE